LLKMVVPRATQHLSIGLAHRGDDSSFSVFHICSFTNRGDTILNNPAEKLGSS